MSLADPADAPGLLFAVVVGMLGLVLCVGTELIIARFLPRLGPYPALKTRITTAALTGLLCTALALRTGENWALPAFLALAVLSVQLGRVDLEKHLLPNPMVLTLLFAGLALLTISSCASGHWARLFQAITGAALLFLAYLLLALITPHGIGMGDVKLAAPIGLYLGYMGWGALFYGGALAFVVGGVSSVVLVGLRRLKPAAEIAFGPSMLGTTLCIILFCWR